jgi:hypothetical protein
MTGNPEVRSGHSSAPAAPIRNQSNKRLLLAGIAGEKRILGFRTCHSWTGPIYKFLLADHPRIE